MCASNVCGYEQMVKLLFLNSPKIQVSQHVLPGTARFFVLPLGMSDSEMFVDHRAKTFEGGFYVFSME
jgi:hypothetical protein